MLGRQVGQLSERGFALVPISRIVERNLDTDTNRQLVDSFIDQVGSN